MDFNFLIQILLFCGGIVGACWTVYQTVKSDLERYKTDAAAEFNKLRTEKDELRADLEEQAGFIKSELDKNIAMVRAEKEELGRVFFTRLDQKNALYFETFLSTKLYDNDQKHLKERNDDRFLNIMTFVKDKYESLTISIDEIKDIIKANHNNNK